MKKNYILVQYNSFLKGVSEKKKIQLFQKFKIVDARVRHNRWNFHHQEEYFHLIHRLIVAF